MLRSLHDKAQIATFAQQNPLLRIYELGDLDDFYWGYTYWYGWYEGGEMRQLALIYASGNPVLIAYAQPPYAQMRQLLQAMLPLLPRKFYAHLTPDTFDVLEADYVLHPRGLHLKMGLSDLSRVRAVDTAGVECFSEADLEALRALYAFYPENHFDSRMLQTGGYFGIRENGQIVSVAGIHVLSPEHKVASLGNITTHPEYRGRGFATKSCAALCQWILAQGIEHIGLNLRADNVAALATYTRLGFTTFSEFDARVVEAR